MRDVNVDNTACNLRFVLGRGGRGVGEGEGNLRVILVRVCFQNIPHSYTWPSKKRTHSYT